MVDVHCHLQFEAFENDYEAVMNAAFEAGVTAIINTGTQISSSQKGVEFAEKYQRLYAIVGVHPHHADKMTASHIIERNENDLPAGHSTLRPEPHRSDSKSRQAKQSHPDTESSNRLPRSIRNDEVDWIKELEELAKHPKTLAIGEIGLDYFSYKSNGIVDPKLQKGIFEKQIDLANRVKLPLQIHNRLAGEDVIEILRHHKNILQPNPGMFHCFAGSMEVLQAALDLGFSIGFDGNSTYKGLAPGETVPLPEQIAYTPLDRIVVETDSPYLTPMPYRGKRNEPKHVILTARFIADIKKISYEELVEQTDKNVYTLFSKLKIKN
jgi:TatD DNase family protein